MTDEKPSVGSLERYSGLVVLQSSSTTIDHHRSDNGGSGAFDKGVANSLCTALKAINYASDPRSQGRNSLC
ncbi:hypothetical protein V2J09_007751 [Rumex salicifolius]